MSAEGICPVCDTYSDEYNRKLDQAGRDHHVNMAKIRQMEAAGRPIERVFDTVGYHERVLTIQEFDEDEAA